MVLLNLSASFTVVAETEEPRPVTHFLIDASGSMKEEIPRAKQVIAARSELLGSSDWKAFTYFGGKSEFNDHPVGCQDEVVVSSPVPRDADNLDFPRLGGSQDKTSIGQGLIAVLENLSANSSIVLITDGSEECNSDFL